MSSYENNICEAIELIVNKAVSEASYDRTIQGTIVSCDDATVGQYTVKYQDSKFTAFSSGTSVSYTKDTEVYVLIPNGDSTKDVKKVILGTVGNLGADYVNELEAEETYEEVGTNVIKNNGNVVSLSSYEDSILTLYQEDDEGNVITDLLSFDKTALEQYLKESEALICKGFFKTSLSSEHQSSGNYGIRFQIEFQDNNSGGSLDTEPQTSVKEYILDIDNMVGNPYALTLGKEQSAIFDIDGVNFKRVKLIQAFAYGFLNEEEVEKKTKDIFISQLSLTGAVAATSTDLSGVAISFYTPDGTFFPKENSPKEDTSLRVRANVKIKGKIANASSQGISFYWFKEDASITAKSTFYSKYGGTGWRILNEGTLKTGTLTWQGQDASSACFSKGNSYLYSIDNKSEVTKQLINGGTLSKDATIAWTKDSEEYYFKYSEIKNLSEQILKCVIDYNGSTYSKTIKIKNLNDCYTISLESSDGTQFYYDNGVTTLKCVVLDKNKQEDKEKNFSFKWVVQDSQGKTSSIENASKELAVKASSITTVATYKCSVYCGEEYYGTGSIQLSNALYTEGQYSVVIENGEQIFKYDENGTSPACESNDKPITIPSLTFSLYDNHGTLINNKAVNKVQWEVPIKNTLLTNISGGEITGVPNAAGTSKIYENVETLSYQIADTYNNKCLNNTINLSVTYKDLVLTASTQFVFTKQGESGTNGTEFVCKIVPNLANSTDTPPENPTVFIDSDNYINGYNFNRDVAETNPFTTKLYQSGELVNKVKEDGSNNYTASWSILSNKYSTKESDPAFLQFSENNAIIRTENQDYNNSIIKATVEYQDETEEKKNIYATLPLIVSKQTTSDYKIVLKDNTGFRYVQYTSSGNNPSYDSSVPFEIEVYKNEVLIEDLSYYTDNWTFKWAVLGTYKKYSKDYKTYLNISSNNLVDNSNRKQEYSNHLEPWQASFKPSDLYDGVCINNAVSCTILEYAGSASETEIGKIIIPIHFFLNKNSLSAINEWDGNSISLDEEGGYILSPRVGAGKKESDNSFTGVLMGEVQEPNRETSDIGLLGYYQGERSFFLDSESGGALFGKTGSGQIGIDPSQDKALLYSHNFWKEYKDNGFPVNCNSSNEAGQGLLIDLSTPEIRYGSSNFKVDSQGNLTAKSGYIGDWYIDEGTLHDKEKNTILHSDGQIETKNLYAYKGGTIGNWNIADDQLYSNMYDNDNRKSFQISLSTNKDVGIRFRKFTYDKNGKEIPKIVFKVNKEGVLTATTGTIGSWTIEDGSLWATNGKEKNSDNYNKTVISSDGSIYTNNGFKVDSNGKLQATAGTIGGWKITKNGNDNILQSGKITLNGTQGTISSTGFSIGTDGTLTASDGHIGGCSIEAGGIRGGQNTWYISSNGDSNFGTITVYNSDGSTTCGDKTQYSSGYSKGGNGTSSSNDTLDNILRNGVQKILVNELSVSDSFSLQGKNVQWSPIRYPYRITRGGGAGDEQYITVFYTTRYVLSVATDASLESDNVYTYKKGT
jgi:hypothetical protein